MTKEELIQLGDEGNLTQQELEDFFDSNVCIPKDSVIQTNILDLKTWVEIPSNQWRIKPSEPIYEYKWRVGCMFGIYTVTEQFLTEQEVDGTPFLKIEETKRVRT